MKIDDLIDKYSSRTLTEDDFLDLRNEMKDIGLDHLFPETLSRLQY